MAGGGSKTSVRVRDNSREYLGNASAEIVKRLEQVGAFVAGEVRRNLSTSTRSAGASAPGDFPRADTGLLRGSVEHTVRDDMVSPHVAVGTAVFYGKIHEDGLRSFLARTVRENAAMIRHILARGLKKRKA